MIVGKRTEPAEERDKRHIEEIQKELECLQNELESARKKGDKKHEEWCITKIQIDKNTLKNLE